MIIRHTKFNIHNSTFVLLVVVLMVGCAMPPARVTPTTSDTTMTFDTLIAPDAKLKTVFKGDNLFEGPLWLPDGRWIVSEIATNTVWQFDSSGNQTVFLQPSNNANGHALDASGNIIQAEHSSASISRITLDGKRAVLAEHYDGKQFNSPNDVAIKHDGTIWFTDPTFGLGDGKSELGFTGVFKFDPKTGAVLLLNKSLEQPNGIAFSLDEKTLYVSASGRITVFPISTDGILSERRDFGAGNDGLKVDAFGNVWSTGGNSVEIYTPAGRLLGSIPTPETTTNLAFGGPDGKTVYITTFKGVYRIEAKMSLTK